MGLFYPERICCLTEETTELLYQLGEEDRIVGISGFTVRPKRARKEKPKVSAFVDADIPKIEALKPDLILAFSDIQASITKELISKGYTVFTFNQRSVAEILNTLVWIGSLVGRQRDVEELAHGVKRRLDEMKERNREHSTRPRIYFEEWPDPMISGICWVSELIDIAGGVDIFGELAQESLAKDRIVTPEMVVEQRPDAIIGSWCGKKVRLDEIRHRFEGEEVPAVNHNDLYEINSSIILQPGLAALTDGVEELERIITKVREERGAS